MPIPPELIQSGAGALGGLFFGPAGAVIAPQIVGGLFPSEGPPTPGASGGTGSGGSLGGFFGGGRTGGREAAFRALFGSTDPWIVRNRLRSCGVPDNIPVTSNLAAMTQELAGFGMTPADAFRGCGAPVSSNNRCLFAPIGGTIGGGVPPCGPPMRFPVAPMHETGGGVASNVGNAGFIPAPSPFDIPDIAMGGFDLGLGLGNQIIQNQQQMNSIGRGVNARNIIQAAFERGTPLNLGQVLPLYPPTREGVLRAMRDVFQCNPNAPAFYHQAVLALRGGGGSRPRKCRCSTPKIRITGGCR